MRTSRAAVFLFILSAVTLPRAAQADAQADRIAAVQATNDLVEWMTLVKPKEAGHVTGMSKKPKACLDALAAMKKEGKADGEKLQFQKGMERVVLTIGAARAMCEKALVDAQAFEAAVTGREGAGRAAVESKFKGAGIKGDRLKLFIENSQSGFSWYGRGCETEITDPKELKVAKVLFQWTNGSNGSTLVTKYAFKDDKYKVSSREFYSTARAQDWCK